MVHDSQIQLKNHRTNTKCIPQKSTGRTTIHEEYTNSKGNKNRTNQSTHTKHENQTTRKDKKPPQRGTAKNNHHSLKRDNIKSHNK
jgi:hypothetical protein